jgi:hypothetical protein
MPAEAVLSGEVVMLGRVRVTRKADGIRAIGEELEEIAAVDGVHRRSFGSR